MYFFSSISIINFSHFEMNSPLKGHAGVCFPWDVCNYPSLPDVTKHVKQFLYNHTLSYPSTVICNLFMSYFHVLRKSTPYPVFHLFYVNRFLHQYFTKFPLSYFVGFLSLLNYSLSSLVLPSIFD